MKLSNDTITLLKNFASINQGLMFKKGKTLRTISNKKSVMAQAEIGEEIPTDFAVYDLNNFLSVLSLHNNQPEIDFEQNNIIISGLNGRSRVVYRFCSPSVIMLPPENAIAMPTPEVKFTISKEDFDWIMKASMVLSSTYICLESDGDDISVSCIDLQNDSAHSDSVVIGKSDNQKKYKIYLSIENMKRISGNYEVELTSQNIAHFTNKDLNLQYWIATEPSSKIEKD